MAKLPQPLWTESSQQQTHGNLTSIADALAQRQGESLAEPDMALKHYPHLYQDPLGRALPRQRQRAKRNDHAHVAVLLALYNGERFLGDQLESLARQTHRNWSLSIRDDRSSDNSVPIAQAFRATMPGRDIRIWSGEHLGFSRNFLALLSSLDPTTDFFAYCDQDDIWHCDKLARAVDRLSEIPAGVPALYCGPTIVTDARLRTIGRSPHFKAPPSFRNALVQNIAGGNTMVANRAALQILKQAAEYLGPIPAHDWWTYQVMSAAGGTIILDSEPMVKYRQHGHNNIGSNRGLRAKLRRLDGMLRGDLARWSEQNTNALAAIPKLMTPKNRDLLYDFMELRELDLRPRLRAIRRLGLKRQTRAGQAGLWAAAALGKL